MTFDLARGLLAAAALGAAVLGGASGAFATDTLNLLVMGEDADPDTIRRNTQVFDRVVAAIADEMRGRGVAVYDETAVTMDFYDLDRVNRPDAELISLARTVQIAPIHAVTAFEIFASVQPSPYEGIYDLQLRIPGRVIDIRDGRRLGGYEVGYRPGDLPPVPLHCDRDCLLAFVGDHAARIGRDLGAALAAQLAPLTAAGGAEAAAPGCEGTPATYTLAFTGFTADELARIDSFLGVFQGHARHDPLVPGAGRSETRYETCAAPDRLERNLRAMFEQTGTEVWLEADDTGFEAARLAAPAD